MMVRMLLTVSLLLAWACGAGAEVVVTGSHLQSQRGTLHGFPILILRGDAAERGQAHGRLAAREIIDTIDTVATAISAHGMGNWETLVGRLHIFEMNDRFGREIASMVAGITEALPDSADRIVPSLGRPISTADIATMHCVADLRCSQFSAWGPLSEDGQVIVGRNVDYAPIIEPASHCLIAVEPSEPDLPRTLDVMAFGSIGAGALALNEHGVYLAPNNGNRPTYVRPGVEPGPMIYRRALEAAGPHSAPADILAVFEASRCAYSRIFHVAFTLGANATDTPCVIQWDCSATPRPIEVRRATADMPHALILTNHFLPGGSGDSLRRYDAIHAAIRQHMTAGTHIGATEAKAILGLVDKDQPTHTTFLSGLVWPAQRQIEFAVSPRRGESALKGTWHVVRWEQVFGAPAATMVPGETHLHPKSEARDPPR